MATFRRLRYLSCDVTPPPLRLTSSASTSLPACAVGEGGRMRGSDGCRQRVDGGGDVDDGRHGHARFAPREPRRTDGSLQTCALQRSRWARHLSALGGVRVGRARCQADRRASTRANLRQPGDLRRSAPPVSDLPTRAPPSKGISTLTIHSS